MRLFSLEEKTALITGAASGNGRTFTGALLSAGADVWMLDRDYGALKRTLENFRSQYPERKIESIHWDLDVWRGSWDYFLKEGGCSSLDILVNNAGVSDPHDWQRTFNINVTAVHELIGDISKIMPAGSSIINITSLNSGLAFPNNPAYVASKGALKMLTKAWALDLAPKGIRVNNLELGYFHTAMTDKSFNDPVLHKQRSDRTMLGRWGEKEDLYGPIVFLASSASSYITAADITVTGGWEAKGL